MEWVHRFHAAGAAADLEDLGVEADADLDHLEREEAEQLARKLKPVQKRKFLALYGGDEPEPEPHSKRQRSEMSPSVKQAGSTIDETSAGQPAKDLQQQLQLADPQQSRAEVTTL